jgi:glycogen debranching enzyme
MSVSVPALELIPIPSPHVEPRLAFRAQVTRKVENLTLIDGKTFLATTIGGDILPPGAPDVGFFHDDTRFLSHLELRINHQPPIVLSSNTEKSFVSQIELTTQQIRVRDSFEIEENTIHIRRQQLLDGNVLFDRFTLVNFCDKEVTLSFALLFAADFVDVFQVRGTARSVHGQYFRPVQQDQTLSFFYRGRDGIFRQTRIEMKPVPSRVEEGCATWDLNLLPMKRSEIEVIITPIVGDQDERKPRHDFAGSLHERRQRFARWENSSTQFSSNNSIFDAALHTAISDFHGLQIPDERQHILGAGIPWFATIFGRDSILAAYQSLSVNPQLAIDTLQVLARYQGTKQNDWQDEQPGKILHESRQGEMTRCAELPFGPYYGSIDSTPLFLILLSETYNWTADTALVKKLLPAAYAALDWIDQSGDLDHDGFIEYLRRSPKGLNNQAWKDSWDAYMRPDRTVAPAPIAPVEAQGYVYDAKYRMASLLRSFGDSPRAEHLKKEAIELSKRLDRAYWMPDRNFYAMALDSEKQQLKCVASNPGHLLFSRAVPREKSRAIVTRMMREDMFSGWGWRTLSQEEPTFNPLSYHRGSVWPHDNSVIAHGMALNEFRRPAIQILTALFQAALNFRNYRLPELFCGVQRREHDEPVHYPVSCSPQAWASGSWFLILTSILGIRPCAPQRELNIINPELPDWLDSLRIRNLRIGNSRVGLDFTRHRDRTFCNVVDVEGERLLVNVSFKKNT